MVIILWGDDSRFDPAKIDKIDTFTSITWPHVPLSILLLFNIQDTARIQCVGSARFYAHVAGALPADYTTEEMYHSLGKIQHDKIFVKRQV